MKYLLKTSVLAQSSMLHELDHLYVCLTPLGQFVSLHLYIAPQIREHRKKII